MQNKPFHLILGSQSPRRKELLSHLGVPFYQMASQVDEHSDKKNKAAYVKEISRLKMNDLWEKVPKAWNPLMVTSDTVVVLGNKVLGKPADQAHAKKMLKELSGKSHYVYTALSYQWFNKNKICSVNLVDKVKVTFYPIDQWLIDEYVASGQPMDKAGAYGLQGYPQMFLKKIEGNYSSVVGFPLGLFCDSLKAQFKLKKHSLKELFIQDRWF
ncbi:MAG: septum formation protein Maf [Bacteriovoracaceae bacterium]|nr:septum formation protein Maf [Bacteriovoracaceae bacterium]